MSIKKSEPVVVGPTITTEPADFEVKSANSTATFTVEASGTGTLRYQWESKEVGSETWTVWAGKTAATMTCKVTEARDGLQVRCVVTDDNGSTTSQAATMSILSEFKFELIPDTNSARLVKYNGSSTNPVVPASFAGNIVTEIGREAFYNNKTIVSVTLPNSIAVIGQGAFKGCTNLSQMTCY